MRPALWIADDPGLPPGDLDPLAGLDEATRSHLLGVLEEEGPDPERLLPVPIVPQTTRYSCGAAVILACLRYWGAATYDGEPELSDYLDADPDDGTDPDRMAALVRQMCLQAEVLQDASVSDLRARVGRGETVIVSLQAWTDGEPYRDGDAGHYVVVLGLDAENVYVMDPWLGVDIGYVSLGLFEPAWRGNYRGKTVVGLAVAVRGERGIDAPSPLGPFRRVEVATEFEGLDEGKAIGSAKLGGDVAARDAVLRTTSVSARSMMGFQVRSASANAARDLAPVVEEARKALGLLVRMFLRGKLSYDDAQLQTAKRLREAYERAREIGRSGAALDQMRVGADVTNEEEAWFRTAVREELGYWHVFLEEIHRGHVLGSDDFLARRPSGRLYERVEAYLKAIRFMYESARVYALPRETLIYWMGPRRGDPGLCPGCLYLMERSPFPKERLPAVPADGMTECLTNCRHRVVIRVPRLASDVARRLAALPSRAVMVRELEALREQKHGTWRREAAKRVHKQARHREAANPFKGQALPRKRGR